MCALCMSTCLPYTCGGALAVFNTIIYLFFLLGYTLCTERIAHFVGLWTGFLPFLFPLKILCNSTLSSLFSNDIRLSLRLYRFFNGIFFRPFDLCSVFGVHQKFSSSCRFSYCHQNIWKPFRKSF